MLSGRQRILILGCGGAGKSTFARRLGAITGLPVHHLDRYYWRPGWQEPPQDQWLETVQHLVAGERWIIEGNFSRSLHLRIPRSDAIAFLDYSRLRCLTGAMGRCIRQYGQVRADMAPGCPECIDLKFLKWILMYPHSTRPETLRAIESAGPHVERVILQNRRQAQRALACLASESRASPTRETLARSPI